MSRYLGDEPPDFVGGFQVSLDLTKAFDTVARQRLIASLVALDLPENVLRPLIAWLAPGKFFISHKGHTGSFWASRGLRQGSTEAPFEWVVYVWQLSQELRNALGNEWADKQASFFADDFHVWWEFDDYGTFKNQLQQLGKFLHIISLSGLQINREKSAVLLRASGKRANSLLGRHVRSTGTGPQLKVPMPDKNTLLFPMVSKHSYLGCIISYKQYEDFTLEKRCCQASTLFAQLRPILSDSKHHSLHDRLRLYNIGVLSSLQYGVLVSGLTRKGAQKYHSFVIKHLRHIARSPRHLTHETNEALVARLHQKLPLEEFVAAHQAWKESFMNRQVLLHREDILRHIDPPHALLKFDSSSWQANTPTNFKADVGGHALEEAFQCQTCNHSFESIAALRIHATKMNHSLPTSVPVARPFDMIRDAFVGISQCQHCLTSFSTWRNLKDHISLGRCTAKISPPTEAIIDRPLVSRPEVVLQVQAESFHALFVDKLVVSEVQHHCVLCHKWNADPTALSHHLRAAHRPIYDASRQHLDKFHELGEIGVGIGSCRLCGLHVQNRKRHRCPIVSQVAILHEVLNVNPGHERRPGDEVQNPDVQPPAPFVCSMCNHPCKTKGGLRKHQNSARCKAIRAQLNKAHPCQHCSKSYKDTQALKRHCKRSHPPGAHSQLPATKEVTLKCFFHASVKTKPIMNSDPPLPPLHQPTEAGHWEWQALAKLCHLASVVYDRLRPDLHKEPLLHQLLHTLSQPSLSLEHICCHEVASEAFSFRQLLYFCENIMPVDGSVFFMFLTAFFRTLTIKIVESKCHNKSAGPWLELLPLRSQHDARGRDLGRCGYVRHVRSLPSSQPRPRRPKENPGKRPWQLTPENTQTRVRAGLFRDLAERFVAGSCPTLPTSRTAAECDLFRHVADVLYRFRSRHNCAGTGCIGSTVEISLSRRHSTAPTSSGLDEAHVPRTTQESGQCPAIHSRCTGHSAASSTGLFGRPKAMEFLAVGRQDVHIATHRGDTDVDGRCASDIAKHLGLPEPPHRAKTSEPAVLAASQLKSGALESGDFFETSARWAALGVLEQAQPKCNHSDGSPPDQADHPANVRDGLSGLRASSHSHAAEGSRQGEALKFHSWLKSLRLGNGANWCWLNAIYLSYGLTLDNEPCDSAAFLRQIPWPYRKVYSNAADMPVHLICFINVSSFDLPGVWGSQQDAGEGITEWLTMLHCQRCSAEWQLRSGTSILDIGGFHQPIVLHLPLDGLRKRSLASLISQWSQDVRGTQALVRPSPTICLMIARFHRMHGRRFDHITCNSLHVQIPVFAPQQNSELLWSTYRLVSGIIHFGNNPRSGHYQAISFANDGTIYIWDDNLTCQPCQEPARILKHLVVIWMTSALPA